MPRIVSKTERIMLGVDRDAVRAIRIPDRLIDQAKSLPAKYSDYSSNDKCTLFNIIEEILEETISSKFKSNEFFNEFVDVKEVPYGRYNSDSDYWGS